MLLKKRYRFQLIALSVLVLASLACNLSIPGAQPPEDASPIPVSTESLQSLEEELRSAGENAQKTGVINLQITESELTSLVALQLKDQTDPEIQDVQVYLRDGQIQVYGKVVQSNISLPLKVILTVQLDAAGKPHTVVQEGKVGPVNLSQDLRNKLASQLDSILYESLGLDSDNTVIESIQIADGVMSVSGHTN